MKLEEIELLEHILENRKAGRAAGYGLILNGEASSATSIFGMGLYEGYAIAPRTHVVNGFTVPAPEVEALARGDVYFIGEASSVDWYTEYTWYEDNSDKRFLERGLVHLTRGAAIVNAKAMLGIDPDKD